MSENPLPLKELTPEHLQQNLQIFESELSTLLLQTQINMRKLTVNDVQLSDLMKTAVSEYQMDINQSVAELHQIMHNCQKMQDEFMQIEALQKKIQIFRMLCEDVLQKKQQELAALA